MLAAGAAALALAVTGCSAAPAGPADALVDALDLDGDGWTWTPQSGPLELGVTHTEFSLDPEEPAEARQRGLEILRTQAGAWQNVHLMGFGTLNPEPSPDEYDWSSLDLRMQLVEESGGRTVLTLCCSPDWMKGGKPGETDYSRIEEAPLREYTADFAELSAEAVRRYPQVERVLVWNELKGFYNTDEARWDYEGYTTFYNAVHAAVKEVRPEVLVGGPYVVLSSLDPGEDGGSDLTGPWGVADQDALDVVEYWLDNNTGADFLVVDGGTGTRQETDPSSLDAGARKYADLDRWLRERSDLPIWWAEFYPNPPEGEEGGATSPVSAAATLASVAAWAESGAAGALLWRPQADDELDYAALWTDSTQPDGGRPTPLTAPWGWLAPRLAAGGVEVGRSAGSPLVVFRADDGALVLNPTGEDVRVGDATAAAWSTAISGSSG
jgi:hypothetical protein